MTSGLVLCRNKIGCSDLCFCFLVTEQQLADGALIIGDMAVLCAGRRLFFNLLESMLMLEISCLCSAALAAGTLFRVI